MKQKRLKIYNSRLHLAVTIGLIVVPFIFLLVFSQSFGIGTGKLFSDLFISVSRLAIAYVIGAFLGWVFAAMFYKGKRAAITLPIFDVLQSFPTFAALPLVVFFWGATNGTIIFFLIVTVIWPIFFSVVSSLKLVRHDWEEAVEMSHIGGLTYIRKFLWPISIPGLITGTIVGLGDGWEALIATEIIVNIPTGLGSFFNSYNHNLTITALGILGFLLVIFSINKIIWLPLLERSHNRMEE